MNITYNVEQRFIPFVWLLCCVSTIKMTFIIIIMIVIHYIQLFSDNKKNYNSTLIKITSSQNNKMYNILSQSFEYLCTLNVDYLKTCDMYVHTRIISQ